MDLNQVIIKPVVTEKSSQGWDAGRYTFIVHTKATKIDVKNAIKSLYGIAAQDVNVKYTVEKIRKVGRGRTITKRNRVKTATVNIGKNEKLDMYKFKK